MMVVDILEVFFWGGAGAKNRRRGCLGGPVGACFGWWIVLATCGPEPAEVAHIACSNEAFKKHVVHRVVRETFGSHVFAGNGMRWPAGLKSKNVGR